jgi:exodeoxyribonuclease VII small subunit
LSSSGKKGVKIMEEKKLSFEEALDRLEKVVNLLESGNLSLDDTLKCYEEGTALLKICDEYLKRAEGKIRKLTKNENGEFVLEDLEFEKLNEGE